MGTWSISPTDGGASIDENGVANIPSNVGGDDFITYKIKYTDDDGCSTSIDYEVPPCDPQCECSDIEGRITYTNEYLPTTRERNVMLFSANTQGCGSISAFCSSEESGIFESDGDNLVRVEELEVNKKYAVYANVLGIGSNNERACTVNIYIKLRDGNTCETIRKTFFQSKNVNCNKLQDTSSRYGTVHCYLRGMTLNYNTNVETIAQSYDSSDLNSKGFFLLEGDCPNWIARGDVNNIRYVYSSTDKKWYAKTTVSSNTGSTATQDRGATFTQVGYILKNEIPVNPGFEYTAGMLKRYAGTVCGESSKTVTVSQYGCNCSRAWTSSTESVSFSYSATTIPHHVDINEYLNSCARFTGVSKKEVCDWLTVGTYDGLLSCGLSENDGIDRRDCAVTLYITDSSGSDPCEKTFRIFQSGHPLDCTDCDSVKAKGFDCNGSFWPIPATGGTSSWGQFRYPKSMIQSPCNGNVTYEISTAGIEHPCVNPRLDHSGEFGGDVELFFTADPNTDTTKRSFKLIVKYSNSSISNCTTQCTVFQEAPDTPTPTYKISTQVNRGSVTTAGSKAENIKFTVQDTESSTKTYTYSNVNIDLGSSKEISYKDAMIGKEIKSVTIETESGDTCGASFSPTTIGSSTNSVTLTLTSATYTCTSSSYEFSLNYTEGGRTTDTPISVNSGQEKKIGELANRIPSYASSCCGIEISTEQGSVFDNDKFRLAEKSGGGYEIYATAKTGLSAEEVAPVNVKWYYKNSSGTKVYPTDGSKFIYLKNLANG